MKVKVIVDRPLGSRHPKYPDMLYEVNYGYAEGIIGGDGEGQDVYILGVDIPVSVFYGEVIAVIRRKNDCENKWVVAPEGCFFSKEEIITATYFQEKYFDIEIELTRRNNAQQSLS